MIKSKKFMLENSNEVMSKQTIAGLGPIDNLIFNRIVMGIGKCATTHEFKWKMIILIGHGGGQN